MGVRQPHHPSPAEFDLANVLHALGDPMRLQILQQISGHPQLPCCHVDLPIAKSTLSHHLRVLREAGLVWTTIEGTQHRLCLRTDELQTRFPGVLKAVLQNLPS
jgi:predicted transcriptional regulator